MLFTLVLSFFTALAAQAVGTFSSTIVGPDEHPFNLCAHDLNGFSQSIKYWDRLVPIYGTYVMEDHFASTEAKYINPNEFNHHSLKPHLKGLSGTYVGVGTFRALNTAVMGGFEDVVLMDYDLGIAAFNRLNLELIATAADRLEYLFLLFFGDREGELLSEVRAGNISENEFIWRISRFATGGKGNKRLKNLDLALPRFSDFYAKQISAWSSKQDYKGQKLAPPKDIFDLFDQEKFHINEWVFRVPDFGKNPDLWNETYLGNDHHFSRLQSMVREGRIHVLCGDLAGHHAMSGLAVAFKKAGKKIALFDVSNAPEWLEDSDDLERRARYFTNLRNLPWSEKGMILSTGGFFKRKTEEWAQSLVSHKNLSVVERFTSTRPRGAQALRNWSSANDSIYGPDGPGVTHRDSIFIFDAK